VLNKTNIRVLAGAFGDNTDGWVNKTVVVYPTTTEMAGKTVPCLRIRIPAPKQIAAKPGTKVSELGPKPQPTLTEEMNDEIPDFD